MDNILFIPGIANPVSEINSLLFGQGQQGTFIAPSLTPSLISSSTFGTGVETLTDLSPRNNPFSQANSGNRAAWFREPKTGRRNLLLHTNDFQNPAGWGTIGSTRTGTEEVTVATVGTGNQGIASSIGVVPAIAGEQFVAHVDVRNTTGSSWFVSLQAFEGSNFISQSLTSIGTVAGDWVRVSRTFTCPATTTSIRIYIARASGAVGESIQLRRPQIETGSTPTAYQRVTTAFDVTEQGQRDCYGVRADGTDDGYVTAGNVDFSGTDKVTVFAAVRKLSDAAGSSILAHGADFSTVGAFELQGNTSANATTAFRGRSTSGSTEQAGFTRDVASPSTFILTATIDYSLAAGLEFTGRYNQVAQTQNTGEAQENTGTLGNHALHLFRRGGTTLPFNGNLYALIVAGGSYPLSTIQRVERILSRITPTVNL
jgi:hypothetical protein